MKISVAGDFSPKHRVPPLLEAQDYERIFGDIKQVFANTDFNIVNFETTIPEAEARPIEKIGPNLSSHLNAVSALKWAGINVVTLANNHACDFGPQSLLHTIEQLDRAEIAHVGAGRNLDEANNILYINKHSETLAIINCCEHEFGIASATEAGTNPLDPIRQYNSIIKARENADYVLAIVHGGAEGFQLPTPRMQDTYRFFVDAGADAVINHHQHCFSGIEVYKGKPIYYGLGNFIFDYPTRTKQWTEGIIATLDFTKNGVNHTYIPYIQFDEIPGVKLPERTEDFDNRIKYLSSIIADRSKLEALVADYFAQWKPIVKARLQPYSNRVLNGLYHRGLLPSLLTSGHIRMLQNMVNCETHRERLQYFLDNN